LEFKKEQENSNISMDDLHLTHDARICIKEYRNKLFNSRTTSPNLNTNHPVGVDIDELKKCPHDVLVGEACGICDPKILGNDRNRLTKDNYFLIYLELI